MCIKTYIHIYIYIWRALSLAARVSLPPEHKVMISTVNRYRGFLDYRNDPRPLAVACWAWPQIAALLLCGLTVSLASVFSASIFLCLLPSRFTNISLQVVYPNFAGFGREEYLEIGPGTERRGSWAPAAGSGVFAFTLWDYFGVPGRGALGDNL